MILRLTALLAVLVVSRPLTAEQVETPIRLVLPLTTDQVRPELLDRWSAEFEGGLASILSGGVVYPRTEQDAAATEPEAGRATLVRSNSCRVRGAILPIGGSAVPMSGNPVGGFTTSTGPIPA